MKNTTVITTVIIAVTIIFIAIANAGDNGIKANSIREESCSRCHPNFKSVLPENHPAVSGNNYKACMACHSQEKEKQTLIDKTHGKHSKLKCSSCHVEEQAKP